MKKLSRNKKIRFNKKSYYDDSEFGMRYANTVMGGEEDDDFDFPEDLDEPDGTNDLQKAN